MRAIKRARSEAVKGDSQGRRTGRQAEGVAALGCRTTGPALAEPREQQRGAVLAAKVRWCGGRGRSLWSWKRGAWEQQRRSGMAEGAGRWGSGLAGSKESSDTAGFRDVLLGPDEERLEQPRPMGQTIDLLKRLATQLAHGGTSNHSRLGFPLLTRPSLEPCACSDAVYGPSASQPFFGGWLLAPWLALGWQLGGVAHHTAQNRLLCLVSVSLAHKSILRTWCQRLFSVATLHQ